MSFSFIYMNACSGCTCMHTNVYSNNAHRKGLEQKANPVAILNLGIPTGVLTCYFPSLGHWDAELLRENSKVQKVSVKKPGTVCYVR